MNHRLDQMLASTALVFVTAVLVFLAVNSFRSTVPSLGVIVSVWAVVFEVFISVQLYPFFRNNNTGHTNHALYGYLDKPESATLESTPV